MKFYEKSFSWPTFEKKNPINFELILETFFLQNNLWGVSSSGQNGGECL